MKKRSELFNQLFSALSEADIISGNLKYQIAKAIRKSRKKLGLSQKDFAKHMGVSQSMVSKWESSGYNFTIDALSNVCEKLSLDAEITLSDSSDTYKKNNTFSILWGGHKTVMSHPKSVKVG